MHLGDSKLTIKGFFFVGRFLAEERCKNFSFCPFRSTYREAAESSLALGYHVVRDGIVRAVRLADGAEVLLVLLEVVAESHEESFGMKGVHKDTLAHRGALAARKCLGKIENELGWGMGDDGKIGIGAGSNLVANVEVEILGVFVFLRHDSVMVIRGY